MKKFYAETYPGSGRPTGRIFQVGAEHRRPGRRAGTRLLDLPFRKSVWRARLPVVPALSEEV